MPRQRFPRQSAASSGGAATSSSNDVTTPGTSSGATTLGLASATGLTSGLSSSPTSGAVKSLAQSSQSSAASSSAGTTSTSQSTSSSQSKSNGVPSTSSLTPTSSSSSISPSTTSSTDSPSSSVPSSTTTQPPITSSSQQGTPTTITSSYTTYVNGSLVATQTSFPSTIPALLAPSSTNRAAIIGGSAAGGTAVLILLLTLAFCARRKRFKRLGFLGAVARERKQIHSRATLLDTEDLVGVDLQRPPHRYTDYETPWDAKDSRDGSDPALIAGRVTPGTPHTLTGPSRWSEASSAFKEEVWPPPHEGTRLMDPLANRDDLDLTRIVDDVMGPSSTAVHFSDRSVSSMYRDSVAWSEGVVHSRTVSNASNAALLEAAGLGGTSGAGAGAGSSPSTAPVRSSPLAQPGTKHRHVNAP